MSLFPASWLPRSLVSRMLWMTLLAIALGQGIATAIWYSQFKQQELEGLKSTSADLAASFATTAQFFTSLPLEYRHLVLDQLRNMGGTRFFVSLNEEEIRIDSIPDGQMKRVALATVKEVLQEKLQQDSLKLSVDFSKPETLHVLNNDLLLKDLPRSWAHYSLTLEPLNPPVLVVQIQLASEQWLYIAALLPAPYVSLKDEILPPEQWLFLIFMTAFLLLFIFVLVRWQLRPIKRLAQGARDLSKDLSQPLLKEQGARELVETTQAFNRMHIRLQRYMKDREQLFRSISHDLKTPITRLRLRAELLEDETKVEKFHKDLDELETMVKGALQTVKDTDIHENIEPVEINELLQQLTEDLNQSEMPTPIQGEALLPYSGKPLALKRCITNLVENAYKYGQKLEIVIQDSPEELSILFQDEGPGIPESQLEHVFEPYTRLATDQEGSGLGLGIARNIAHGHGGQLTLANRPTGGLQITLSLPRD